MLGLSNASIFKPCYVHKCVSRNMYVIGRNAICSSCASIFDAKLLSCQTKTGEMCSLFDEYQTKKTWIKLISSLAQGNKTHDNAILKFANFMPHYLFPSIENCRRHYIIRIPISISPIYSWCSELPYWIGSYISYKIAKSLSSLTFCQRFRNKNQ